MPRLTGKSATNYREILNRRRDCEVVPSDPTLRLSAWDPRHSSSQVHAQNRHGFKKNKSKKLGMSPKKLNGRNQLRSGKDEKKVDNHCCGRNERGNKQQPCECPQYERRSLVPRSAANNNRFCISKNIDPDLGPSPQSKEVGLKSIKVRYEETSLDQRGVLTRMRETVLTHTGPGASLY